MRKSLKVKLILIVPFLVFVCCDRDDSENVTSSGQTEDKEIIENASEAAYLDLMRKGKLQLDFGMSRNLIDPDNLFGEFYHDRAAYYIIDRPEIFIGSARVLELTLYFVDDILLRKKYLLHKDISNELIMAFGSFKFRPLDKVSSDFIKEGHTVITSDYEIDNRLKKFRLSWEEEIMNVEMNVIEDSLSGTYTYIEEHPEYPMRFSVAQSNVVVESDK